MFVKICGTTTEEDALLAVALGADALGFIFAPSPRQVTATAVSDIVKRLPPDVFTVGVFRNDPVDRVLQLVAESGVKAVQLHGDETPSDIAELKSRFAIPVIKALPAASQAVRVADQYGADAILLDAPSPGSGQVFDWRLAEGIPDGIRLILAGGLDPSNVADAIEAVKPWGVDVVSGVESKPGVKDPRKLREFVESAKRSAPEPYHAHAAGPYDWQEEE